jgi:hypothetical protein
MPFFDLTTMPLQLPPLPLRPSPPDDEPPFEMVIAAGPYTSDGDLLWNPWHTLRKALATVRPAVVLLVIRFCYIVLLVLS